MNDTWCCSGLTNMLDIYDPYCCDRPYAPNIGIIMASGHCTTSPSYCSDAHLLGTDTPGYYYAKMFPARFIVAVGG